MLCEKFEFEISCDMKFLILGESFMGEGAGRGREASFNNLMKQAYVVFGHISDSVSYIFPKCYLHYEHKSGIIK